MIYEIIASILLFANNLYYNYASNLLSISQVLYLKYAEEIGSAVRYLLNIKQILYFIDIPIILMLWHFSRKDIEKKKSKIVKNRGKRKPVQAIILCALAAVLFYGKLDLAIWGMNGKKYSKTTQVAMGSIYGYHILDIHNSINTKGTTKYKTYDELMADYNLLKLHNKEQFGTNEAMDGIAYGKNVIILQLESVQNFVVDRTYNGKEITPNLNKFLHENIRVNNMISQSYSTTADSEYSVITSMFPLDNGQAFSGYSGSINNDIFSLYHDEGYNTSYMHGNVRSFWNRGAVYHRLGIDELVFLDNFEDTSEKINSYLSDELFYKQAVQKLESFQQPFMTYLVAASSHIGFDLPGIVDKYSKVSVEVEDELKENMFGKYIEAVNYADRCFGIFVDELKEKGLYDDTVIIVFGDHNGLDMYQEEMEAFIKQVKPEYNDIDARINFVNVLCGLKLPGVEGKEIDYPVSKLDIKPTLLELSGIDDDVSLGESFFSDKKVASISNHDIVTDKLYYHDNTWYDIETGNMVDLTALDEETRARLDEYVDDTETELDISRSVLINNLLKKY